MRLYQGDCYVGALIGEIGTVTTLVISESDTSQFRQTKPLHFGKQLVKECCASSFFGAEEKLIEHC